MGTRIDLRLQADTPAQAAQLAAGIEHDLSRWGREWYPWGDQQGELKALNSALHEGHAAHISPELRDLLLRSQRLQRDSEGFFDPATAPMVQAWGFVDSQRTNTRPSDLQLQSWARDHATLADLVIDAATVSSARRDLQLDLGAIAKGYALEVAAQRLRQARVSWATLNIGGQWKVLGNTEQTIGIRDPRQDAMLASLHLAADESVSTSGDYERFAIIDGQRIHHLLDPHTGMPVTHTQAVTVVTRDATLADAASTALMAAGPDHWQRIARQLGVRQVLRIDSSGAIEVTAALYARLQWNPSVMRDHSITQVSL